MAIKLAFSTVACPEWTLEKVAQQAQEMGYDGVELRTLGHDQSVIASDPALSDAAKARQVLASHNIEPVCLSTSISLHAKGASEAHDVHWKTVRAIELAAELGCPSVRLFCHRLVPGDRSQDVMQRAAERLNAVADKAAEHGVQLLMENAGSFSTAKQWWWMLNLVEHPMVGLCWNVANAAAAGEPPSVSVPTLNSRIRLAKIKDTRVGEGSGFVPLGEGTVGVQNFIRRLLGVGYGGYLSVEWDRAWLPTLAPAEEYLPDAIGRVRGWLDAITEAATPKGKGAKAAPAKAAKPAADKAAADKPAADKTDASAATSAAN